MFAPTSIHVIPYLGRDYKSKKAVLADWDSRKKDFLTAPGGQTISKSPYILKHLIADGVASIQFRYDKKRKTFLMPLEEAFQDDPR